MGDLVRRLLGNVVGTQLLKYAVVGLLTNAAGYAVYLLLTVVLGLEPKVTMSCLYVVGATAGFFSHRRITFTYRGSHLGSGTRYVLAHLMGYGLNLLLLLVFVDGLGVAHEIVQAAAIFVVAAFLFVTFKLFVFPVRTQPAPEHAVGQHPAQPAVLEKS